MKRTKTGLKIFLLLNIIFLLCPLISKAEELDKIELIKDYKLIKNINVEENSKVEENINEYELNSTINNNEDETNTLIPNEELTKEYFDTVTKLEVIKIYESLNILEDKLLLKYETLNENIINVGFNTFEDEKEEQYKFYLMQNNEVARGLVKINEKTYLFDETGKMLYGLQIVDNEECYFDLNTGELIVKEQETTTNILEVPRIGLVNINENYYYYTSPTYYIKNTWKTINNYQYYFGSDGKAYKGIRKIGKSWYYFNTVYCMRQEGLVNYAGYKWYVKKGKIYKSKWKETKGKTYYFNKHGHALRGIKKIKGKWYYFNTSTYAKQSGLITYGGYKWYIKKGKKYKSTWKTVKGKKYYFNSKGHAKRGIKKIRGKWYYFNTTTYAKQGGLITYKGHKWYIKSGKIYKSKWKTINGRQYYFNKNGHAVRGINIIKKKLYFFNPTTYYRQDGLIYYNGRYYCIKSGKMYKNTWVYFNTGYKYFGSDGKAYYNVIANISGTYYNFNSVGNVTHGYFSEDGNTYYKDAYGNLATGYKVIYGQNKFFSEEGIVMSSLRNVIDISYAQGSIDWSKVKASGKVNGVIVRLGFTGYGEDKSTNTDEWFVKNIKELKRLKIPYGVYYWGFARDTSKAIQEANYVLNVMRANGVKPTYGVYYDAEIGGAARTSNNDWAISEDEYKLAIPAFINTIRSAGYKAGVYSNADSFFGSKKTTYNSSKTKRSTYGYLNNSTIKQYPLWIAHYNSKCSSHYSQKCGYSSYYGWQYTSSGSVSGISGNVDMNFWYRT